jgi:5,5'-dehydrodivanillate O-demethylase
MYHGWMYNGAGQCVDQPAEDESFAGKIHIRSCPTEEYLGLIFAWLGEGQAPPLPRYPRFEREGLLETLPTLYWPCNYFQRLENHGDTVHLVFVHRDSHLLTNTRAGLPTISREESEWGLTAYATFPGGASQVFQFGMPNVHDFRLPAPNPEIPYDDRLQWMVPVDDENSAFFRIRFMPISDDALRRYQEHQALNKPTLGPSVAEMGEAVLADKVSLSDLPSMATNKIALANAQDYVAQVGQGRIANREEEHLGRSDVGVIVFRKVWERELRALAEGRPLKTWKRTDNLDVSYEPGLEKTERVVG